MTTANSDTLQIDSVLIGRFTSDSRFDYDRELYGGHQNLLEWLSEQVSHWLRQQLGMMVDSEVVQYALIGLGVAVVALLAWLVWRRRNALFDSEEQPAHLDYTLEEDTIYGVDFEGDIAQMTAQANWRQAVRLVYLYTLRQLSDAGRIDWQPSKTPAQYAAEVGEADFTTMSDRFVRVRYGNFGADEQLYQEMERLRRQLNRTAEPISQPTTKGGVNEA